MKHREKISPKRIFSSKLFLLAVLLLLVLIALAAGKGLLRRYQVNREIKALEEEIARLENSNQELGELIEYLNTDFFAEQEARLKLGMSKEGEKVIIVPDNDNGIVPLDIFPDKEYNEKAISNPQKWWRYFFGHIS